jgi:hypothetical protein
LTVIYEDDLDFAAIVGVDRAGGVDHGNSVSDCEAASGANLGFGTKGQSDANSGRDEFAFAGGD